MQAIYNIDLEDPFKHYVRVKIQLDLTQFSADKLDIFLPSWSPGSYLMREYARHVRLFKAQWSLGEDIFHEQTAKGIWQLQLSQWPKKQTEKKIEISYEVYCHELTVRTSHVTNEHAFLHGPTYLMGVMGEKLQDCQIIFKFPPQWTHLATSLKDISTSREIFAYEAEDYDHLLDSPVEIGCHESDGFLVKDIPHALCFYGDFNFDYQKLKADMKKVTEFIVDYMGDIPYTRYSYITHFVPQLYGGLEHHDSTVLHFDGRKLNNRDQYLNWISLVAHEYFHTWNVKRIRPVELGPFDYLNENYTSLLWLAEGLTSFVDNYFILKAGLCDAREYLAVMSKDLKRYFDTPGRRYDSLEMSSFNAWVKLYRPDENSNNSSVSYYLKGGLVFFALHVMLMPKCGGIKPFIDQLWKRYKERPEQGETKEEIYKIIQKLGGDEVLEKFKTMIETTDDIAFEPLFAEIGCELVWERNRKLDFGFESSNMGDRLMIRTIAIDTAAHKAGLNTGDEILAINGQRVLASEWGVFRENLKPNTPVMMMINRLGRISNLEIIPEEMPRSLNGINLKQMDLFSKF